MGVIVWRAKNAHCFAEHACSLRIEASRVNAISEKELFSNVSFQIEVGSQSVSQPAGESVSQSSEVSSVKMKVRTPDR